jgi:cell shape-determining protein MreC
MAVLFLLLAVIVGVVIGDAVVANTSASSVQLFDRTITGFTQGELLVIAAGAGFIVALLLFLAFGSSKNRRLKRRERRIAHRDFEGRIAELERENADLRDEVEHDRRTSRLGDMAATDGTTETSGRIYPRSGEPAPTGADTTTRTSLFNRADR